MQRAANFLGNMVKSGRDQMICAPVSTVYGIFSGTAAIGTRESTTRHLEW
jgi:hypothetical protein